MKKYKLKIYYPDWEEGDEELCHMKGKRDCLIRLEDSLFEILFRDTHKLQEGIEGELNNGISFPFVYEPDTFIISEIKTDIIIESIVTAFKRGLGNYLPSYQKMNGSENLILDTFCRRYTLYPEDMEKMHLIHEEEIEIEDKGFENNFTTGSSTEVIRENKF